MANILNVLQSRRFSLPSPSEIDRMGQEDAELISLMLRSAYIALWKAASEQGVLPEVRNAVNAAADSLISLLISIPLAVKWHQEYSQEYDLVYVHAKDRVFAVAKRPGRRVDVSGLIARCPEDADSFVAVYGYAPDYVVDAAYASAMVDSQLSTAKELLAAEVPHEVANSIERLYGEMMVAA